VRRAQHDRLGETPHRDVGVALRLGGASLVDDTPAEMVLAWPAAGAAVQEHRAYRDRAGVVAELARGERHERAGRIDDAQLQVGEAHRDGREVAHLEPVAHLDCSSARTSRTLTRTS
jgi:hypothetical protein